LTHDESQLILRGVWEVEVTDEFVDWWSTLTIEQQEAVTDRIDALAERGPDLGRPIVDRIHASRHQSMKELRAAKGGALRVLFTFDPRRQAILLFAVTSRASGTTGTSGQFRSPTTCTTNTSTNSETKD
jgi:hypothetical protein